MNYITYKNIYSDKPKHIITEATIYYGGKHMNVVALWDTGASHSHVAQDIIEAFDFEVFGETRTISHDGYEISKKYVITIILPTTAKVDNITVLSTQNVKYKGFDIGLIIGMDIIQCGDFHLDYTGERAVFTFRHPYDGNEDKLVETELF